MSAYRAPRGKTLTCANWHIELRSGWSRTTWIRKSPRTPEKLIVYGGFGRAARHLEALQRILATLKRLVAAAESRTGYLAV